MMNFFDALVSFLANVTAVLALEWCGAALGLAGAFLLATHSKHSSFGWVFFLASNFVLIAWATKMGAIGLLVLQAGFTVTSLIGLKRSGLIGNSCLRKKEPPAS